jgi:hypothetical protein
MVYRLQCFRFRRKLSKKTDCSSIDSYCSMWCISWHIQVFSIAFININLYVQNIDDKFCFHEHNNLILHCTKQCCRVVMSSVHIYFASYALFVTWWLVLSDHIYNIDHYISPLLAVAILRNHDYKFAMHYWVNEGQNATPPPPIFNTTKPRLELPWSTSNNHLKKVKSSKQNSVARSARIFPV